MSILKNLKISILIIVFIFLLTFSYSANQEKYYYIEVVDSENNTFLEKRVNNSFEIPQENIFINKKINISLKGMSLDYNLNSNLKEKLLSLKENESLYLIVSFNLVPTEKDKMELEKNGMKLISYVPKNSWYVKIDKKFLEEINLENLKLNDKKFKNSFLINSIKEVNDQNKLGENIISTKENQNIYIHLIENNQEISNNIVLKYKLENYSYHDSLKIIEVDNISIETINLIKKENSVKYISKAEKEIKDTLDISLVTTNVSILLSSPYSLDGEGIVVMVYEAGTSYAHEDFNSRFTKVDTAFNLTTNHSTSVTGILISNGSSVGGNKKGILPNGTVVGYHADTIATPLSILGDFREDFEDAIDNRNSSVSSNSWFSTNITANCNNGGRYTALSELIDQLVRGEHTSEEVPIVFAAGNSRLDCPSGGGTMGAEASAKNVISVGSIFDFVVLTVNTSSQGPTEDGRLKPEIVAPGYPINTTTYTNQYEIVGGTSFAAPHISGIIGLMKQEWIKTNSDSLKPNTFKAILIDTSRDISINENGSFTNDGPDYTTGYGLVNAQLAVDYIRDKKFVESNISSYNQVDIYSINITNNSEDFKVTLVWDDPASEDSNTVHLINDLDIELISPSGIKYFPWTLNPNNISEVAKRTERNDIDNVEQVYVNSSENEIGEWLVKVYTTSCPECNTTQQNYSLASNSSLSTNFSGIFGDSDLIAYYPFDGVLNNTQSSYDGNFIGNETYVTGINGQAIFLDGDEDYISVGTIGTNVRNVTISAWINDNTTDSNYQGIVYKGGDPDYSTDYDFYVGKAWGFIHSRFKKGSSAYQLYSSSTNDFEEGVWNHHVWTLEDKGTSTQITMYVNGVQIAQQTVTGPQDIDYANWYIGKRWYGGGGEEYRGSIDDLSIWKRVFNESDILKLYSGGIQLNTTTTNSSPSFNLTEGLLVHHEFESDLSDSSGNGYSALGNSVTYNSSGYSGDALILDGSSAYLNLSSSLPTVIQNVTIAAWIHDQNDDSWYNGLVLKGDYSVSSPYDFYIGKAWGRMHSRINSGGAQMYSDSNSDVVENTWKHHVWVFTKDGSNTKAEYYIDGTLIKLGNLGGNLGSTSSDWYVGRTWSYSSSRYFDASIDDLAIWDRSLSYDEVEELYDNGITY